MRAILKQGTKENYETLHTNINTAKCTWHYHPALLWVSLSFETLNPGFVLPERCRAGRVLVSSGDHFQQN